MNKRQRKKFRKKHPLPTLAEWREMWVGFFEQLEKKHKAWRESMWNK